LSRLLGIGAALLAIVLVGPTAHRQGGDLAFIALVLAHGGLLLWAVRLVPVLPARRALYVIGGVAVALRLGLLFVEPHLSTDIYRYIWDGRVQGAGINPYRFIPYAPELEFLRDEAIFPNINRPEYAVTIYPPAAQILFLIVGQIADGLVAMKLAFLACEAVTILVLRDLLRRVGQPATRIVAYAWHPLAVWEIAGSGHIDAAMVAAMMVGLWLAVIPGRRVLAAAVLAVATLIKPFAILALPVAWRPWDWRAPAVAIGVAILLYLPYLSVGWGVLGFLPTYLGEEQIDTGEGFWLVATLTTLFGPQPWLRAAYLVAGAMLLTGLALRISLSHDQSPAAVLKKLFWLLLAALWLLSPDLPWYYLILVPFVTLHGGAVGWAATLGVFVLYEEIWADLDIPWVLRDTIFNLTLLGALLWTLRPAPQPEISRA
jgi:alpha-1,6-mannosyltransferase